jgi:protein tyrosine phosphatase (PTP) superfamily phosphohydrolase (DUF442 family)
LALSEACKSLSLGVGMKWSVKRWVLLPLALVLSLGVTVYALKVFAGLNQHTVIEGQVYRTAQPSETALQTLIAEENIRTVINLRGTAQTIHSPRAAWYAREAAVTQAADISQEDITLSAFLLPPPAEIRRLVEVLDRAEKPVLLHCKQGADRTGLASAMVILLQTQGTLADARRELWPIYGHFPVGRTTAMDDFLDRYETWLGAVGEAHSNNTFRKWVTTIYTAGPASSQYTWIELPKQPVPVGQPFALKLRAKNTSSEAWEFKVGNHAGIHLLYKVASAPTNEVFRSQAGLFRRTVAPGETIDLTLAVPGIPEPGIYAVIGELIDARGCSVSIRSNSFVKLGDDCAITNIEVK